MDPYYYSTGPSAAGSGMDHDHHQYQQHHHPDHFVLPATSAAAAPAAGAAVMVSSPASDKARMGELAFLRSTLMGDGFFLPLDWEESVLGLILSGLRCVRVRLAVLLACWHLVERKKAL